MKKWIAGISAAALMLSAAGTAVAAPAEDAPVLDCSTLVTFGDSLTALSSWPQDAAKELNMYLVNAGIGGHTSANALARFDRDVASKDPDFVTIAFGTNDFVRVNGTDPQVSLEDFRTNMETIVDKVEALDAIPILFTAPYVRDDPPPYQGNYENGLTAALDEYNAVIREIAADKGVYLVDMREMCDSYDRSDFLVADGVHLSDVGKKAYTDTLVAFMREHFRTDPDAPRVEYPERPTVEPGTWTKDIISFDPADWMTPQTPDLIKVEQNEDGSLSFYNTNGLWPEMHYSPSIDKGVAVPLEGSVLNYDIVTEASAGIGLFFDGSTPTLAYDNNNISLAPALKKWDSSIRLSDVNDILPGQHLQGSIPLTELGIPESAIEEDGSVLFSGVKVFAVGTAYNRVIINELSVSTGVEIEEPDPPTDFETTVSLLPTEEQKDQVTQYQGVTDVTFEEDGSLRLARSEESDIAWPSVAIALNQTVDLSTNPYLHLKFVSDGGTANGMLYYTDESGEQKSAQFSQLVNGDVNDFPGDGDAYVDLAAKLESTGVITINQITLSVYGSAGQAVVWQELALAKEVEEPDPTDPDPSEPTNPSASETDPSPSETDPSATATDPSATETTPSASETDPTQKPSNPATGESGAALAGAALLLAVACGAVSITRRKK